MTVDFAYRLVQFITSKSQNGYVTPDEFNLSINQAQTGYLDYLLGQFQQYRDGRPVSRVQFGENEITRQRLSPVIVNTTLSIDGGGEAAYPADYQQTDTLLTSANAKIKYVKQDYLASYLSSRINPVATNPIYLIENAGFKFYPATLGSAKLSYIKTPPTIVWGYTTDVNGLPVYDAGASVDPVWDDVSMMDIISRALRIIGVNLQSNVVSQYANEIKMQGQ